MSEHRFEVGDRVWWLHEDARLCRFPADVPAVITHVRRDILTIEVINLEGRAMSVHIHPEHLRPRDSKDEDTSRDGEQRIEIPIAVVTDLLAVISTTHKWIDTSLAGDRAHSHQASKIIGVMQLEFQQIREMNVDAIRRARAWVPTGD